MTTMTAHGIVSDLRSGAKTTETITLAGVAHDPRMLAAADEIERLRDELVKIHTDRPFVMGFNQGWDAAVDSGEADESTSVKRGCVHCDGEFRVNIEGENLCQHHANEWVRGEGLAANEMVQEGQS